MLILPIFLCISIQLVGIVGNALVIHVIFTQKRFQTNYYYLVYHLAVSDLFVLLTFVERTLEYCFPSFQMITSSTMCKLSTIAKSTFYTSGVVFLVLVGLLRYRGVTHPLKIKFSRGKTRRVVVASYLCSLFISIPYGMLFRIKDRHCQQPGHLYVYNVIIAVVLFLFAFLVPVVLLLHYECNNALIINSNQVPQIIKPVLAWIK